MILGEGVELLYYIKGSWVLTLSLITKASKHGKRLQNLIVSRLEFLRANVIQGVCESWSPIFVDGSVIARWGYSPSILWGYFYIKLCLSWSLIFHSWDLIILFFSLIGSTSPYNIYTSLQNASWISYNTFPQLYVKKKRSI